MVVNPVTIHPDQTLADARALMATHRISGIPVVERAPAGWSAFSPIATCGSPPTRVLVYELMTRENLITVTGDAGPGGGAPPAAPSPHREAAGGGRRLSLRRADHREGHGQGGGASAGQQG